MSDEKEILDSRHVCFRCKGEFHQLNFHVGSGYCDDCYDIVNQGCRLLRGEHIEEADPDFKYPSYEQAGSDKKWDDMSELEQASYNHCKTLNALAVCMTTAKRRRIEIERLTLERDIAQGCSRDLKENVESLKQMFDVANVEKMKYGEALQRIKNKFPYSGVISFNELQEMADKALNK